MTCLNFSRTCPHCWRRTGGASGCHRQCCGSAQSINDCNAAALAAGLPAVRSVPVTHEQLVELGRKAIRELRLPGGRWPRTPEVLARRIGCDVERIPDVLDLVESQSGQDLAMAVLLEEALA